MSNFKIGDRVICINNSSKFNIPLKLDRKYIIYDIRPSHCGTEIKLNVGLTSINIQYSCPSCNTITSKIGEKIYFKSSRFRKVEEKQEVNYIKLKVEIEEPCLN